MALLPLLFAVVSKAQNTPQVYVDRYRDNAIGIMAQTGVPASVVLAIAMHESACGNSTLARRFNNQFGFKGNVSHVISKKKHGRHKRVERTYYKKYNSVQESFDDFADKFTHRKGYSQLSGQLQGAGYTQWVRAIQHCGYAASRKWGSQVLALINKYKLYVYDDSFTNCPGMPPNTVIVADSTAVKKAL